MGDSQVHINFITLFFSVSFIFLFRKTLSVKLLLCIGFYFYTMQLFLFGSVYNALKHEQLSMSSLFSALRPVLLFLLYLSTAELCRRYEFYNKKEFKLFIVISFIYIIAEVFFIDYSKDIVTLLYKREYREELFFSGTSFFGTSYYSGYSFLCVFILSYIGLYNNRKTIDKIVFVMAFFLVLISLSKAMIFSLAICSYFMLFIYFRSYFLKFLLFFVSLLFVYAIPTFQTELSEILSGAGVPALSSIKTLLYDPSNSGSFSVRLEQIVSSFEAAQSYGVFFGAGLGQNVSIESLPAVFLYRYGFLGLLFFYLCNFSLMIFSIYKILSEGREYFAVNFSIFLWLFTLPVTQLSGAMIEQSKMALVSAIMLGYLFRTNYITVKKNHAAVSYNSIS